MAFIRKHVQYVPTVIIPVYVMYYREEKEWMLSAVAVMLNDPNELFFDRNGEIFQ